MEARKNLGSLYLIVSIQPVKAQKKHMLTVAEDVKMQTDPGHKTLERISNWICMVLLKVDTQYF